MLKGTRREREVTLVDLGEPSSGLGRLSRWARTFWKRLRRIWLLDTYRGLLEDLWHRLDFLMEARSFLLAIAVAFAAAIGLVLGGYPTLALLPALAGFGLSLAGLLYGALPPARSWLETYPGYVAVAAWTLVATLFAFVGFSSTAVVFLVLFIGGFTVTSVLWGLLPRILAFLNPLESRSRTTVTQATSSPVPLLLTFGVVATWSLMASFIMGYTALEGNRPWGAAFLAMHIGLLAGTVPLLYQLLREVRRPTMARWHLFRPRRLLRDVIYGMIVGALVGYEVNLASTGAFFGGIPAFALVLVLLSYVGVLIRQPFSFGARLRPYHPLVLPAFGALLLFAPTVVLLSSPPVALTRLYGAAQAAGLVLGTLFILMRATWVEHAHRIRVQVEEAVRRRIPGAGSEEPKEPSVVLIRQSRPGDSGSVHVKDVSGRRES